MMPFCSWVNWLGLHCGRVGENKVGINVPFQHPYLCDQHHAQLLTKLGIKEK